METNTPEIGLQLAVSAGEINTKARELAEMQRTVRASATTAVEKAMELGSMLISAKKTIGHGGWEQWVAENLEFSLESAALYSRLAANPQRVTDFLTTNPDASLRAVAGMLTFHALEARAAAKGLTVKELKSASDAKEPRVPAVYKAVDAFWSWAKTTPPDKWGEVERHTFLHDLARRNQLAAKHRWEIPATSGETIDIEVEVLP